MLAFLWVVLWAGALTQGVVAEYDVFVYGATPAGVLAAAAAAGEGRTVLLADPRAHIGGMVSGGLCVSDIGVTTAVLGGRTRAFFEAITAVYGGNVTGKLQYNFEPHVASSVLQDLFLGPAAAKLKVALNSRVLALSSNPTPSGPRVVSATMADGNVVPARVFVDASYEGWLLPLANVSFTWGREPASAFNESVAGVLPVPHPTWEADHPFVAQPQAFTGEITCGAMVGLALVGAFETFACGAAMAGVTNGTWPNGTVLPGVSSPPGPVGSGDHAVQSYSFRSALEGMWMCSCTLVAIFVAQSGVRHV